MENILAKLISRHDLTTDEVESLFAQIFSWDISEVMLSAILVLLRSKWENIDEVYAATRQMRKFALKVKPDVDSVIDTCWTWWDWTNTFNISTTCAFVLAWAWLNIAKHWNRSNTSKSWSSDLLTALWVDIDKDPSEVEKSIEDIWIGFLFAPKFHSAMKYVVNVRKELGIRTIFNLLWPLTNPAWAQQQVIWVYDESLLELYTWVLLKFWVQNSIIVHWSDWMDEITLTWKSKIVEIKDSKIIKYDFDPKLMWFSYCKMEDLIGWDPNENADITLSVLKWEERWPKRDIVVLNSAAWLKLTWKAANWEEAIILAAEVIDEWYAMEKLEKLIKFANI